MIITGSKTWIASPPGYVIATTANDKIILVKNEIAVIFGAAMTNLVS